MHYQIIAVVLRRGKHGLKLNIIPSIDLGAEVIHAR
jgi:hypothetical protein